jgi:RNA polymerase sigma-70 factor (ECF subfamily)
MKVLEKEAFASGEEPAHSAVGHRPNDESGVLRKLLDGDAQAFWALVEGYHPGMLRFAGLFVSNAAIAEEVVQETWLAVVDGLASFERRSSLKGWIYRILANRAKTRAVREGRSIPFSSLAEAEDERGDAGPFDSAGHWQSAPSVWTVDTPERLLLQKEAMAHLMRAIDGLPPQQRAVLTLRDVEGLPSADICNILEISETNQRVLLHRARSKARAALQGYLDGA